MGQVVVVGGGAAGMMAAARAAERGFSVLLLEQNEKLGKKLYITGKGRCNLTNACDPEDLRKHVTRNPRFLYSAFSAFSNLRAMEFFQENGLRLKTERGERVFPASDHASDVTKVLQKKLQKEGVEVRLRQKVKEILQKDGHAIGVGMEDGSQILADDVVIATGGRSYPSTGATGDGYRFAEALGHHVAAQSPALVPMEAAEDWVKELAGLSLRNVSVTIKKEKKRLYEGFGELLFTHFGVSGPLVLSASSAIPDAEGQLPLAMCIDLKPALDLGQLDRRLLRDFEGQPNKELKNVLRGLFPARLVPVVVAQSGMDGDKKACEVTRAERGKLAETTKALPVTVTGFRGFDEAVITRGGVSVREVNPSTMESRLVRGLYFAGEVLDVDALTGGFNLQIAWSTGYLAGDSLPIGEGV